MLMIPNILQILSIDIECLLIIRVNLAQFEPIIIRFLTSTIQLLAQFIEHIKVRDYCGKMSPKFYLQITDFFYGFLHFGKKSFEFYYIGKFWIDIFVFKMILNDKIFNDILVSKDCELLLQTRFFLDGNIKFN